jgi:hypothetical protein
MKCNMTRTALAASKGHLLLFLRWRTNGLHSKSDPSDEDDACCACLSMSDEGGEEEEEKKDTELKEEDCAEIA